MKKTSFIVSVLAMVMLSTGCGNNKSTLPQNNMKGVGGKQPMGQNNGQTCIKYNTETGMCEEYASTGGSGGSSSSSGSRGFIGLSGRSNNSVADTKSNIDFDDKYTKSKSFNSNDSYTRGSSFLSGFFGS